MYGRINHFEGEPGSVESAADFARREILPSARALSGFNGMMVFVDRTSGREVVISLWETEEAMRASEAAASDLRARASTALGQRVAGVDRTELVLLEFERPAKRAVEAAVREG